MSTQHHVTPGPMAIGYLPRETPDVIAADVGARLWCPLHDDATHHWIAHGPASSPLGAALHRYDDGQTGSFVVETSSQSECALFEADFAPELEILKTRYERLEVVFGVVSYRK